MRLIDADALVDILNDEYGKDDNIFRILLIKLVKQILNDAPTVDAEPVRHGHWIRPYNDGYKQCSVCKITHYGIPWNAEYCPFCGAKMDEATK